MSTSRLIAAFVAPALLVGCASSSYGSSISGSGQALSPEERRLQNVETKTSELSRRLDAVNLTGMDQENQRLRDDIRSLRGEVERMRYEFDQQQRRNKDLYSDLDRRLQRFELPQGIVSGAVPPSTATVPSATPGTVVTVTPPATLPAPTTPVAPPPTAVAPPPAASSGGIAAPVVISSGGGASVEEETAYLAAFDELKNGKYDAAVRGFKSMLERWPQGAYAANGYFWMGEAYIVKRDHKSALTAFQSLLQRFPTSPKAPDAMLKVGLTQIDLKQEAEGKATLQRVISTYPNSNAAKLAQQRLNPPR